MTLTQHLCKFGFMLGYEVWMHHGESVHERTASVAEEENDRSGDDETHGPVFSWSSRDNLFIFIPFCNMNLLISLHSIFQDDESLGWEEKVYFAELEEDLQVVGLETSDGGRGGGGEARRGCGAGQRGGR
jgi:hypothetical protein